MRLAFVPSDEGGEDGRFHVGETATERFEKAKADTDVTDGDATRPFSDTSYRVDFEAAGETAIDPRVESDGYVAAFAERVSEEPEAERRLETGERTTPNVTGIRPDHDHDGADRDHGADDHDHSGEAHAHDRDH